MGSMMLLRGLLWVKTEDFDWSNPSFVEVFEIINDDLDEEKEKE